LTLSGLCPQPIPLPQPQQDAELAAQQRSHWAAPLGGVGAEAAADSQAAQGPPLPVDVRQLAGGAADLKALLADARDACRPAAVLWTDSGGAAAGATGGAAGDVEPGAPAAADDAAAGSPAPASDSAAAGGFGAAAADVAGLLAAAAAALSSGGGLAPLAVHIDISASKANKCDCLSDRRMCLLGAT